MGASGPEEALFSQDIRTGFIGGERTVEAEFGLIQMFSLATLRVLWIS